MWKSCDGPTTDAPLTTTTEKANTGASVAPLTITTEKVDITSEKVDITTEKVDNITEKVEQDLWHFLYIPLPIMFVVCIIGFLLCYFFTRGGSGPCDIVELCPVRFFLK